MAKIHPIIETEEAVNLSIQKTIEGVRIDETYA
jgi:hypothetical protein